MTTKREQRRIEKVYEAVHASDRGEISTAEASRRIRKLTASRRMER